MTTGYLIPIYISTVQMKTRYLTPNEYIYSVNDHRMSNPNWYIYRAASIPQVHGNSQKWGDRILRARGSGCLLLSGIFKRWQRNPTHELSTTWLHNKVICTMPMWIREISQGPTLCEWKAQAINGCWERENYFYLWTSQWYW